MCCVMKNTKDLSLSGSQMNLHERPSPRTSTPRIKRPNSAVPAPGYDGPTGSKGCYERPQSADESFGTGRNCEFASRCSITKSLLNSQRFDSEFDFLSSSSPSPQPSPAVTLKPGLLTKPPAGPSHQSFHEGLSHSSSSNQYNLPSTHHNLSSNHHNSSSFHLEGSYQSNFHLEEDIVDLKFRNWFPNTQKYANDLPAFVPDSRTSTNDIPSSCKIAGSVSGPLIKPRQALSDNYLNRIGYAEIREQEVVRNDRKEFGRNGIERSVGCAETNELEGQRNAENAKKNKEYSEENRHYHLGKDCTHGQNHLEHYNHSQRHSKHRGEGTDKKYDRDKSSNGDDNTGMETSDNSEREQHVVMYRKHQDGFPNNGKETLTQSMKIEDQLIDNHNETMKIGYERRSVQQNMRYASNREQINENRRRHIEPGQGLKEHKERVGESLNDQPIPHNDAEGYRFDTRDVNRYRFEEQHNAINQFERVHGVKYAKDQDQTDDGIGATSKEYYVEYRDGKSNHNNQEEVSYRYDELHNGGRYGTRHYNGQHTWDNETEESCGSHCKEQSRRNMNEREYRYENSRENARNCEAHDRNYQYYQGTKDGDTNQCDSCKKDQPMNSDRNEEQEYDREIYLKEKENAGSAQNYQNKTLEQNYETNQTESDSAMSEDKNHYINSMDVMDKIYTSKRKSGTKEEREGRFNTNSDEVTNEARNKTLHKNGRRKSMENVNRRLTKSHSEEMYVYWNDEHKTKYVRNRSDQNGVHANEKQSRMNGDTHLRTETPERHYLDRYNFEEEEKILNHILEKSKHGQRSEGIPEIKVNDESMLEEYPVKDINKSTYNEIVDILKVLENEEKGLKTDHDTMQYIQLDNHNYTKNKVMSLNGTGNNHEFVNQDGTTKISPIQPKPTQPHNNTHQNEVETPTEPIHVEDIYSFLDKVDIEVNQTETTLKSETLGCTSKLSELMKLSSADLAQKYLTLSINMDEKQIIITALEKRIEQIDKHCKEMKTDTDATVKRLQKFIAQLIKEKKDLGEQCSEMCKDMEKKYKQIIDTLDERHKIEMKKNTEKHLAAEKIRREKWIDNKTQKIKELTVKGLEPELLKMTTAHQEEIAEMRKAHNRQLEENDAMWNRKISTMKEKFEEDLQNAILQEKENGRKRLDEELKTVESNYQEQRKHLLNEIRIERENLDRQAEDMRNEKEKELNQKLEKLIKQNKESCEKMENKHQDELRKLREDLNQEKQMWVENKTAQMEEKEQLIREQCKRERDKHIELIIQKLEKEQTERNTAADLKLKNIKEQHDKEIEEMESTLVNVKTKLNETRTKLQNTEDLVTELKSQVHSYQIETKNQGELLDKLKTENHDLKLKSEHETNDKINRLEEEIEQTRTYFETLISRMKKDQERELSQVYGRVKETIGKKDEAIAILTQQKEAALTQCANLETIIAQRKH